MTEMSEAPEIPDNAQEMHDRLDKWGLVERVRQALTGPYGAAQAADLLCWVETELDGETIEVRVKVSYRHYPRALFGRPASGPFNHIATFGVGLGRHFGPLGSPPLPDKLVKAIYALGGVTLS